MGSAAAWVMCERLPVKPQQRWSGVAAHEPGCKGCVGRLDNLGGGFDFGVAGPMAQGARQDLPLHVGLGNEPVRPKGVDRMTIGLHQRAINPVQ